MDTQKPALAALVLAGGKSSRMGKDKALIPWQGTPILKRVCQTAATCCQQVYILTAWSERYQDLLGEKYQYLKEFNPGQGPLVALAQGLAQITRDYSIDWILLLACDLPQLETEILKTWSNQLSQLPPETLALVPRRREGWEPLCGFYRPAVRNSLQNFIEQGGRSFQVWLSNLPAQSIAVGEKEAKMLWNCNTPADLDLHFES